MSEAARPSAAAPRAATTAPAARPRKAWWLKTLHQWHWVSAAISLVGMLLFSITGITLNNAAHIEAKPKVEKRSAELPRPLAEALRTARPSGDAKASPLPEPVRAWVREALGVRLAADQGAEWSDDELYVSLPRPGGDAWLRIDRTGGTAEYELTRRGAVSYLNDLHKGRHTGLVWSWFIDLFAVATLTFAVTGLLILKFHAAARPATWPLVALGLVLPLLIALLFMHA